jgi:DNA gyrase subunit B
MVSKKSDAASYTAADSLTVLEGLEAVRKRPGMYIGSTDSPGLQHCLWEIVDNAVDEAIAGFCDVILVTLHKDGSVEVSDNGRGIPVDVEPKSGLTGVELVFTKLHAGGKFGGSGYKVSGGLHGVGASVVNALSRRLDATVFREGSVFSLSFSEGKPGRFSKDGVFSAGGTLIKGGKAPAGARGTTVRYWADEHIFLPTAVLDLDATIARARQTAFLVPGLTITVRDERSDVLFEEVFHYTGGVKDFVDFRAADKPVTETLLFAGVGSFTERVPVLTEGKSQLEDVDREVEVEVALRWGTGYDVNVAGFVNIISTPKGGTHVAGFERAMVKVTNDFLKSLRVLRSTDDPVVKDDVLEGLTAVISVRLSEPQFEGQTKEILGTRDVAGIVAKIVSDGLTSFFTSKVSKVEARRVLEKVSSAAKARIAAREVKEVRRRKNALETSALPSKLVDCRSDDVNRAELFIVEGDSALGTFKGGRNSDFQAALPIRGKILNVMRASEKQMVANTECAAIIQVLGAGSGKSFNVDARRYGKVVLLTDADVDGAHIRTLLLTLIYRYMRPLLTEGHVYSAVPPLHRVRVGGLSSKEVYYTYSDDELTTLLASLRAEGKTVHDEGIQRYKGLGEMDADQLADTTLDPDQRHLRRITIDEGEVAETMFDVLMGSDVSVRRDYIVENSSLLDAELLDA